MPESNAPAEGANGTPAEGGQQHDTASAAEATTTESKSAEGSLAELQRHARHHESEAKKAQKALAAAQAELEQLRTLQLTDQEKAVADAKREGRTEAEKEWKPRYHSLATRTAALQALGGRVVAPDLVLPHLDMEGIELDDDGNVTNPEHLVASVDSLLERYPFLAVENGTGSVTTHPHGDLGARRPPPSQRSTNDRLREALGGRRA